MEATTPRAKKILDAANKLIADRGLSAPQAIRDVLPAAELMHRQHRMPLAEVAQWLIKEKHVPSATTERALVSSLSRALKKSEGPLRKRRTSPQTTTA